MGIENRVSGAIFAKKSTHTKEGEEYVIRSKKGAGWGLPVGDIRPEDLRVLADRIEGLRAKNSV